MFNTLFNVFICIYFKSKAVRTPTAVHSQCSYQYSSPTVCIVFVSFGYLFGSRRVRQNEMVGEVTSTVL